MTIIRPSSKPSGLNMSVLLFRSSKGIPYIMHFKVRGGDVQHAPSRTGAACGQMRCTQMRGRAHPWPCTVRDQERTTESCCCRAWECFWGVDCGAEA